MTPREIIKSYLNQCGGLDYAGFSEFLDSVAFLDENIDSAPICQVTRYKRFREINEPFSVSGLFGDDVSLVGFYIYRKEGGDFLLNIGTEENGSDIGGFEINDDRTSLTMTKLFDGPTNLFFSGYDETVLFDVVLIYNALKCDDNGEISMTLIENLQLNINSLQQQLTSTITSFNQQINNLSNALSAVPSGIVASWSGTVASIPNGWLLCDGNHGTPNLVDKFIIGAGSSKYPPGSTGGEEKHTLLKSELPNIDLDLPMPIRIHHRSFKGEPGSERALKNTGGDLYISKISLGGSGQAFNILPTYYALCFIIKT